MRFVKKHLVWKQCILSTPLIRVHMKELDSRIFNFETSMITSMYHDTSHVQAKKGHSHSTRPTKRP
jgi:hypothetical protein